jgi:hypothetical protein
MNSGRRVNSIVRLHRSSIRMTLQRSFIAGATDYRGAEFSDILTHLEAWRKNTRRTIDLLLSLKPKVEESRDRLDGPDDIISFIDGFVGLLRRYINDFTRLLTEMPKSVHQRHVDTVVQLAELAESADDSCVNFKRHHIARSLKDENLRGLVDYIYGEARDQAIDYQDLSNVATRLKTFVGMEPEAQRVSIDDVDVLELKPNFFGLGLNLNHLIKRIGSWLKISS